MTSRSSFFKLMKEDLRQRLWTIVLAFIVFVLPVPIVIAMMVTNDNGAGSLAQELTLVLQANNLWFALVTVTGAAICAASGFGYLFSKKKVDFFHSLPVKRECLFAIRYLNGIFIYLVPYLTMQLLSFLLIAISGNFEVRIFTSAMWGLLIHFLGYLTVYTVFILSVIFVGNIVVFFAVSGWMFGITAIMVRLYITFEEGFFNTYSYIGNEYTHMERMHSLRFLSPGYFYVQAAARSETSLLPEQLLYTVVLCAAALFLYRIRSSDGAGKAVAFPVLKPVFRVSIELLAGACIGLVFDNIAGRQGNVPGWMIFGTILGVLLSHIFIESIYHYDIRKCFANKMSLLACVAVSVTFVLVMRYDAFGYDKWLPGKGRIASVAVKVQGLDGYGGIYHYANDRITNVNEINYMSLTEIETLYPYLETLIQDTEEYYDADKQAWSAEAVFVDVAYRLKNGKTVYRSYYAKGMRAEVFAPVFESPEYKNSHYAGVYTIPEDSIRTVTAQYAMNECVMTLSPAEKEELMRALRQEVSALTLKEKLETLPVALLTLSFAEKRPSYDSSGSSREYINNYDIPLYASYTETLQFLESRGFSISREYEWTGNESMRIYLPGLKGKEDMAFADTSYDNIFVPTVMEGDWLSVEQENWQAVYELCSWEKVWKYGNPAKNGEYYEVYLEIPVTGYNSYERYEFLLHEDADLSFLFH